MILLRYTKIAFDKINQLIKRKPNINRKKLLAPYKCKLDSK